VPGEQSREVDRRYRSIKELILDELGLERASLGDIRAGLFSVEFGGVQHGLINQAWDGGTEPMVIFRTDGLSEEEIQRAVSSGDYSRSIDVRFEVPDAPRIIEVVRFEPHGMVFSPPWDSGEREMLSVPDEDE
jgi:hypothetical protein